MTDLSAAYSLCVSQGEDFIWEAYGERLKDAVLSRFRFRNEPDPENAEACRKYWKNVQLAILELHLEVQAFDPSSFY